MHKPSILIAAIVALVASTLLAQNSQKTQPSPKKSSAAPDDRRLSLDQIRKLLSIQTPDGVLAQEIQSRGIAGELSRLDIEQLRQQGAGPESIAAMARILPVGPPMTLKQIEQLISVNAPDSAVTQEIRTRGVSEEVTTQAVLGFQQRGAGPDTVSALNNLRRTAARQVFDQALKAGARGDVDGASTYVERAIELDPELAEAYLERGKVKGIRGQCGAAIQDFDRAIQLNRRLAAAYASRGHCYWNLNNVAQAVQDYSQSVSIDPTVGRVFGMRGAGYGRLEDWANSERDLKDAIRLGYREYTVYHNLGFALVNEQKWAEAISYFDQALQLQADYAPSLRYRGLAKQAIGRTAEGLQDIQRAQALDSRK